MENKKIYGIIGIIIVICVILLVIFHNKTKVNDEILGNENTIGEQKDDEKEKLEEVKVTGYHLVTYAQSANSNSLIKDLTITASNDAKIRFVIGSIDSNSAVQERTSFEKDCKKGENKFDLLKERHIVKEGEYLFMDINGQDTLYTQEGTDTKTYVQNENNKVAGKMIMLESNYILPFKYTLAKVENYNALVIGNDITTQNGGKGLNATEENLDYCHITKTRLEDTFKTIKMNAINAVAWEENAENKSRKEWLADNLKKDTLTNLDLVIFQLGDNYNPEDNLEKDMTDFIEYIRQYSPNAEMIWLGLWNKNEELSNVLPGICERLEIEFIHISDLNVPDYQSPVTQTVEDTTKEVYYPNNEAMQIISNRIMEILKFDF